MTTALNENALEQLFTQARTYSEWQDEPISDVVLQQLYDLARLGPTSANCSAGRFVFIQSPEAKARLTPHLSKGNLEKTITAPVTVIVAYDSAFYNELPELFPYADAKSWFTGSPDISFETAFRNSTLQAGYFIIAARSLGLDTGPMSGFDNEAVDKEFFDNSTWKSNFLINLGYGNKSALRDRLPRLPFSKACQII